MRRLIVILSYFLLVGNIWAFDKGAVYPLRQKEPNWRTEVTEKYPEGNPMTVIFYEPFIGGKERAAKKISFYPNGAISQEMDLKEATFLIFPFSKKSTQTP